MAIFMETPAFFDKKYHSPILYTMFPYISSKNRAGILLVSGVF